MAKRSKILNEEFARYIWKEVNKKKKELILEKGPIEISSRKQHRNTIKKHDVKDYLRQILKQRWKFEAKPQKIFKVDKPKKKILKLKLKERKL